MKSGENTHPPPQTAASHEQSPVTMQLAPAVPITKENCSPTSLTAIPALARSACISAISLANGASPVDQRRVKANFSPLLIPAPQSPAAVPGFEQKLAP